jgi:[acyl-carrier-protein] S-malonyltransferase
MDDDGVREGDHFETSERLVVSPAAGLFVPADGLAGGALIRTGDVVGRVADHDVRSPFRGVLQAFVAVDGERVRRRQPIAWLRIG